MLSLQDLLRANSVKRFHIVNTVRSQSLSEHQFGVAVFSAELGRRLGWSDQQIHAVVSAAILHDAGEARTGDIPTPTKKRLRAALGDAFDDVLSEFDAYDSNALPDQVTQVLKCADFLDSMHFLNEHRVGRHADVVMDDIYDDAQSYFNQCQPIGCHANRIWSDLINAGYEI